MHNTIMFPSSSPPQTQGQKILLEGHTYARSLSLSRSLCCVLHIPKSHLYARYARASACHCSISHNLHICFTRAFTTNLYMHTYTLSFFSVSLFLYFCLPFFAHTYAEPHASMIYTTHSLFPLSLFPPCDISRLFALFLSLSLLSLSLLSLTHTLSFSLSGGLSLHAPISPMLNHHSILPPSRAPLPPSRALLSPWGDDVHALTWSLASTCAPLSRAAWTPATSPAFAAASSCACVSFIEVTS
jgi:hypothetical protein